MAEICNALKEQDGFVPMSGCSDKEIEDAEAILGCAFSEDYKSYVKAFGCACANGHEFTGIVDSHRLNVVDVTKRFRKDADDIANELYVIEDMGIDSLVIWQASDGKLYQSVNGKNFSTIPISFAEYINE